MTNNNQVMFPLLLGVVLLTNHRRKGRGLRIQNFHKMSREQTTSNQDKPKPDPKGADMVAVIRDFRKGPPSRWCWEMYAVLKANFLQFYTHFSMQMREKVEVLKLISPLNSSLIQGFNWALEQKSNLSTNYVNKKLNILNIFQDLR